MQRTEWAGTLLSGEKSAKDDNDREVKKNSEWVERDGSVTVSFSTRVKGR